VARIEVLLRRAADAAPAPDALLLSLGDLQVDLARRRAVRAGQRLELSAKEFQLLTLLMRRKGEVLSRTEIAEQVWDVNFDHGTNVIDVAIRRPAREAGPALRAPAAAPCAAWATCSRTAAESAARWIARPPPGSLARTAGPGGVTLTCLGVYTVTALRGPAGGHAAPEATQVRTSSPRPAWWGMRR
jgi:hypothetical protein